MYFDEYKRKLMQKCFRLYVSIVYVYLIPKKTCVYDISCLIRLQHH